MSKQLESFKTFLEKFAANHQADIKKNPEFRQHFQKLCARIGVDPLACEFLLNVFLTTNVSCSYAFEPKKISSISIEK